MSEVRRNAPQEAQGRQVVWKLGALPRVTGDPSLLRVVFVNLLSNAIKFTARREEAVIEVDAAAGENGEVIVQVKDNGAGFDGRYVASCSACFSGCTGRTSSRARASGWRPSSASSIAMAGVSGRKARSMAAPRFTSP